MSDTSAETSTESTEEVQLHKNEGLKINSRQLRGTLQEELTNGETFFTEDSSQLLKFHGSYQQDDRDARKSKDKSGGKAYSCMIRSAIPGGKMTATQFLSEIEIGDKLGNGTMRITTRQGIQHHGVLKENLREVIREINRIKLTSLSACGDVNRNVMCTPVPLKNNNVIDQMQKQADELSVFLKPHSTAYYEIWLKDDTGEEEKVGEFTPVEEPVYGKTYLPRKFKIAFSLPEDNHTDIYTQDLGFLAIVENNEITGYNVTVGGGMGRTPSAAKTFPRIADKMCFIKPDQVIPVAEAIVKVQRDFGNRVDRKVARMKYLINDWGIAKFKAKVEEYYGAPLAPPTADDVTGVEDYGGWHEQGDGKLYLGINIENGRVKDEGSLQLKTGLKAILSKYNMDCRLTALQSVILCDIDPKDKADIAQMMKDHGIKASEDWTLMRRYSIACPALPLCGLSVTESERVMPEMIDLLEAEAAKYGLLGQKIAVHMTGCPNGCARPYTPDIGLVGRAVGKYTVFLGGNPEGTRLCFIYKDMVKFEDVPKIISPLFAAYKQERQTSESFGDYCNRKGLEELTAIGNVG
jgi:sulfite reductase (ferredoxin)